jgi:hypothetical protein
MKPVRLTALFLMLLLAPLALAQGSAPLLTVAPIPAVTIVRGKKVPLRFEIQLNRGFHVNSNKPNDELLLPTVVRLNLPQGFAVMNMAYPEGEQLSLPLLGAQKLSVYSGSFAVTAELKVPVTTALGTQRVHGEVKYQACNDRQCFPPKSTPLDFDVKVVKPPRPKGHAVTPASPHIH